MPLAFTTKSQEADEMEKAFVESLKANGYETVKRAGFYKWMDQEVYLAQKDSFSGVMFVRGRDSKGWRLNSEMFKSFFDMAVEDKDTEVYVVFLETPERGYFLRGSEFNAASGEFKPDLHENYNFDAAAISSKFAFNAFASLSEFFGKLAASKKN